jgi:hypothetical protein
MARILYMVLVLQVDTEQSKYYICDDYLSKMFWETRPRLPSTINHLASGLQKAIFVTHFGSRGNPSHPQSEEFTELCFAQYSRQYLSRFERDMIAGALTQRKHDEAHIRL